MLGASRVVRELFIILLAVVVAGALAVGLGFAGFQ
jgi:hypothetical protein